MSDISVPRFHLAQQNYQKLPVFLKEKICYEMVYYTFYLGKVNCHKLRWKVRITRDEKPNFQKRAWHLELMLKKFR